MGLLQMREALAAAGVDDEQFKEACRNVGRAGTSPNEIRRSPTSTRLADARQAAADDGSSETTDDSDTISDDEDESTDSSSSDDSSSTPSASLDDPEERLMGHSKLKKLALAILGGRVQRPDPRARRLGERLAALEAVRPDRAALDAEQRDEARRQAGMREHGTVREFEPTFAENMSQMSDERFIARSMGLETEAQVFSACAVAREKATGTGTARRLRTLAAGTDEEKVRVTFGVGSASLASLKAAALAKQFGGAR
jgi:hypothetical protein